MSPRAERVLIVADRVSRRFTAPDGDVTVALDGVSADVVPGELTVIAGRSGSGKSTLLGLLGAIDRPDDGEVFVDGHALSMRSRRERRRWRRRRVGIVLPLPSDNLSERYDAAGNVRWAASLRGGSADLAMAERLGLGELGGLAVHELSMGQQMRLAFACAVAGDPQIVLADEPTASLDAAAGAELLEALRTLACAGMSLVVATHDETLIAAADHVVRLEDGRRVG